MTSYSRQGPGPCPMCGGEMKSFKSHYTGDSYWGCVKRPSCGGSRDWNNKNVITMSQDPSKIDRFISVPSEQA